jgi:hypothetical protein
VNVSFDANHSKRVRILFLGQCLQYGYQDVDEASTFVSLAAAGLSARYPGLRVELDRKHLYHPKGLRAILRHRLRFRRPDIVVISVVGTFAAAPTRVNMIYELAPEIVDTARSFLQKIEAKRGADVSPHTSLDGFIAWHPPLGLEEYERLVREGVDLCKADGCRAVLLGPGRFNEDTTDNTPGLTPDLWVRVNALVHRLARSADVPAVDVWSALSEHGGEVFLPNNIRWSRAGHRVVAGEVERVLAAEIAALYSPRAIR